MCVCLCVCVQYVWSGEPVIEFPGFDGQLTDVQMWDYPLSYREVFKYMNNGVYGYVCVWGVKLLYKQLKYLFALKTNYKDDTARSRISDTEI